MSVLKEIRLSKGYNSTQLAALAGIPISTYSMIESGERSAGKEVAKRLGELLGVSPEDIFLPERFTVRETRDETSATKETA